MRKVEEDRQMDGQKGKQINSLVGGKEIKQGKKQKKKKKTDWKLLNI